jgi:predicted esterase YcpF (UPF0227 family)
MFETRDPLLVLTNNFTTQKTKLQKCDVLDSSIIYVLKCNKEEDVIILEKDDDECSDSYRCHAQ